MSSISSVETTRLYGWRHWVRACGAIFRKDFKVFFRYPINAVMRVIEPILWLAPALFLSRAFQVGGANLGFAEHAGTTDYIGFLMVGGIVTSYVSSVFWGMGFALKNEMDSGVLESNWLTPVPPVVQLVGRSLFSVVHTTINTVVIGVVVYLVFGFELVGRVVPVIATLVPLLIALYGFGLGLAALVLISNNANMFVDIGNFLITLLAGQNFPVTVLPRSLMIVSLALPITYAYDVIRGLLLGTRTLLPIPHEQGLLAALMLVTVVPGYLVFSRIERRCRDLGTLARH